MWTVLHVLGPEADSVAAPRCSAQRGCCSSPQPQDTRTFQIADLSHRLHLRVSVTMGQCAEVVIRLSSSLTRAAQGLPLSSVRVER